MAIAMSFHDHSVPDPGVAFKFLNQDHCSGVAHLNVQILPNSFDLFPNMKSFEFSVKQILLETNFDNMELYKMSILDTLR